MYQTPSGNPESSQRSLRLIDTISARLAIQPRPRAYLTRIKRYAILWIQLHN
jgi:hypothetical protein